MNIRRLASFLVVEVLLVSACAGPGPTEATQTTSSPATSTTTVGAQTSAQLLPPPDLDPTLTGDALLVALEARWMCDIQRFAFPDLSAMNEALAERLTPHGLSREDYEAFKTDMESRIDLREQVLDEYDGYCGED